MPELPEHLVLSVGTVDGVCEKQSESKFGRCIMHYLPNPVRAPGLAHLRRSLCDGIQLKQSYIVFDRFNEAVHSAA